MSSWPTIQGRTKAQILREAILATGGPESESLGAIRNYISARYPDFPWESRWYAEIAGAKSALKPKRKSAESTTTSAVETIAIAPTPKDAPTADEAPANAPTSVTSIPKVSGETHPINEIQRAQQFVSVLGEGSVEKARAALTFLGEFGDLNGVQQSIDVWAELLNTVDGKADVAERVLDVLSCGNETPAEEPLPTDAIIRNAA